MAYNEEDYTFRLPKDLATVPVYKLISCLSWSTSQSDFDHVASFLSDRHEALQSQLAALKPSCTQLGRDDSDLKSSYGQLQQENSVLNASCHQLQRDNSALKSSYAQLQQENSVVNANYDQLERDNSALKSSYAQLQEENSVLKASRDQLERDNSALKSSYAQLQQENSVLMASREQLERDNSALKLTCVKLENQNFALKSSNALFKLDNSALESKCGVLVQENTNLSSELDSLKTSYMQLEPVKLRCGLENELEKLKSDLESAKSSYMQAAKEKSPVMELGSVKSTCSQLHQEISEVKSGERSITLENDRKITESMIRKIFSPYGEIVEIELMKDQSSIAKGLCFVRYSKRESALDVKRQKNKVEMRGKKIGLDLSLDQNDLFFGNLKKEWSSQQVDQLIRQAAAHAHHVGSNPDFMLGGILHPLIEWALPQADFDLAEMAKIKIAFVGNLPPAANEYLQKLFGPIGNVEKIAVSRKSFAVAGYVHFATRTDLERAIEEMNGRTVGAPDRGPPFKIKVAVAKTPAKGTVCPRDGVIKARIEPLDMSNKRRDYSPEVPVTKVRRLDNMETAIASLSLLVKERLLTVLRLRIATEHDIDLNCLNGLKELPEACAISVLDQFLFSGADKYDKKSFLDSLIAEKRGSWSTSTSSPCQSDYSLRVPPNEERHHYTHSPRSSLSPVPVANRRIRYYPRAGQAYKFNPYYS